MSPPASPTSPPRVRDLFKIPERIGKMDFTVVLADGIDRPAETVGSYVVTPKLLQAFEQALGLIDQAYRKRQSQAAYLHGSFGSGKSHFMAMLSLLLADHEGAWSRPELHGLRVKFPWIGQAKVLELHVHMLDQPDLATPIFTAYLRHVRAHHPEADLPGIFADEALFEDAARLLAALGDASFFGPMNALAGPAPADAASAKLARGWKQVKEPERGAPRGGAWDRARFEAARRSVEPEVRAELVTALTRTHNKAFAEAASNFVDIDRGLGIISRHAKALGYDVIVLLLDELILWLSYMARDPRRLGESVQRLVKLVEATDNNRPAPFCSMIARQRPLREMVGDALAGPDDAHLAEVLDHARGRFGEVQLGDDNLPAIVSKRVLQPRDERATAALQATFERLRSESQQKGSWTTLLGTNHDAEAFRQVYPFSPVLVDALVALSNALQRQRTAIRLLTELLMRHVEDLQLGQLVGVGDLFDVMAEGEKATEGAMGARFDAARKLYKHDLLPLIQAANQTDTRERCQRLRPEHPPDVGCANCPQAACRNDNRVIKTLLIAALVPGVPAFRELTVRRVVELNHGWLTAKIPGRETTALTGKLRKWAGEVAQIRLGDQADPQVSIQLEGVDVRPLLEQARDVDSPTRRRRVLFELLLQALGEEGQEVQGDLPRRQEWRGTRRPGSLRFDNVRQLGPERLRCPDDQDWRIIIDYPFDEGNFGPHDDERVIREFTGEGQGSWTLVWLPSFFSEASNKTLGELTRIGHILSSRATTEQFIGHLSVEQQEQARVTLENLASQKRQHLVVVLAKAYGLDHSVREDDPDLDPARSVDHHLHLLRPGVTLQAMAAGNLAEALEIYTSALLEARYPKHPHFTEPLTPIRTEKILERFQQIVEAPDKKIALDRRELDELRGTLGALGLVRATETTVHLRSDGILDAIEKRRRQRGVADPRADEVLRWADEHDQLGLQPEAEAVLVRAYALAESRALVLAGEAFDPARHKGRGIPGEVVLELPDLPTQAEWQVALDASGHVFGVALAKRARTGENLRGLARAVEEKVKAQAAAAARLPRALETWRGTLGLAEASARLTTATAAAELIAGLQGQPPAALARALAGAGAELEGTSLPAIGRSLATAREVAAVLDDALVLGAFRQLVGLRGREEVDALLSAAATALRQDELQRALAASLRDLASEAQEVMARLRTPPPEPPTPVINVVGRPPVQPRPEDTAPPPGVEVLVHEERRAQGGPAVREALAALERVLAALRAQASAGEDLELTVRIELVGRTR